MVISVQDRTTLFENAEAFFAKSGSPWMKLPRAIASEVIEGCSKRQVAVSIVEGGIWHSPGFEHRLDAIWHSEFDVKPGDSLVEKNNNEALSFIKQLPSNHDVAIISTFGNEHE